MIQELLDEIVSYFSYLQSQHGDFAAFHNACIPLEGYMAKRAPYTINRNPYCLFVKSDPQVWNHCVQRQEKVVRRCEDGAFCGTCYTGMGEYVFPIQDLDRRVLGFISVSGYKIDPETAKSKMRHFSWKFGMPLNTLEHLYGESLREPTEPSEILQARIAPLCNMFVLLHHALGMIPESCVEPQKQSSILGHAIVYLQRNYTQEIRTEQVANHCHCSVSTMSHLFKKQTGIFLVHPCKELVVILLLDILVVTPIGRITGIPTHHLEGIDHYQYCIRV